MTHVTPTRHSTEAEAFGFVRTAFVVRERVKRLLYLGRIALVVFGPDLPERDVSERNASLDDLAREPGQARKTLAHVGVRSTGQQGNYDEKQSKE